MGRQQGADATSDGETDRQPDQPTQRHPMPAALIIANPGKAGRHHLRDQRDALGDMLVLAEQQHQQRNENAPAGDTEEAGGDTADPAGEETAENLVQKHCHAVG